MGAQPGGAFPSIFPAEHDMPPPRAEAPMDQLQIQQATESLITERNQLNAQAPQNVAPQNQGAQSSGADQAKPAADQTGSVTAKLAAKKAAHKAKPQQAAAATPPATTASAQGAGVQAAGSTQGR